MQTMMVSFSGGLMRHMQFMKGHTGATLPLGKGGIYSGSWKQRLVAQSSTESELVGVYDVLPQVLWTKQFLEEQGWLDSATVVYQDNTSSILLERNGQSSSTKRTKHMNIQYFYVTEQIKKKAIHVTHGPTGEMIGDFSPSLYKVHSSLRCAIMLWGLKNLVTRFFPGVC